MGQNDLNQHLKTGKLTDHRTDAVLAAEAQAEAITVAGQASSFTMSPDHLEEDTGPAPDSGSGRNPDIAACYAL
jgi:hypothetical protein